LRHAVRHPRNHVASNPGHGSDTTPARRDCQESCMVSPELSGLPAAPDPGYIFSICFQAIPAIFPHLVPPLGFSNRPP
jgi:hypothetical protein